MTDMHDYAEQIEAVRRAIAACSLGDVPDYPRGIIALLHMDGWEVCRRQAPRATTPTGAGRAGE
jgi:hypothetical protein